MIKKDVNLFGLTVWCGISSVEIICYFFDGCVTRKSYLEMLQHFLIPRLALYDDDVMFQQYRALPHFTSVVRDFLEKFLENGLIEENQSSGQPACPI